MSQEQMIDMIEKVEQWSREHPLLTNKMKLREIFGNKGICAITSPNMQTLINWLDEPYINNGQTDS